MRNLLDFVLLATVLSATANTSWALATFSSSALVASNNGVDLKRRSSSELTQRQDDGDDDDDDDECCTDDVCCVDDVCCDSDGNCDSDDDDDPGDDDGDGDGDDGDDGGDGGDDDDGGGGGGGDGGDGDGGWDINEDRRRSAYFVRSRSAKARKREAKIHALEKRQSCSAQYGNSQCGVASGKCTSACGFAKSSITSCKSCCGYEYVLCVYQGYNGPFDCNPADY